MGQLDFKLISTCTSSVKSIESCIIYAINRTEDWLRDKDPKEQEVIINSARSENRLFMIKGQRETRRFFFYKTNKDFRTKRTRSKEKEREESN